MKLRARSTGFASRSRQSGFTLLEALIAMLVLVFGMLAAALLMVRAQQAEFESYQRKHALLLVDDFVSRIQANRRVASQPNCYSITTDTSTGTPFLGTGNSTTFNCVAGFPQESTRANADMLALEAALLGAGETVGGARVGALLNARGCVSVTGDAATGYTYSVSIAWQGRSETAAPPANINCGKNQYGAEALRRVVTVTFVVPNLG
jgi:type IV pilus assembly protein PilV